MTALRRRLREAREGDGGFMLIYVLMVTAVIVTLVLAAMVVSASSLVPSVQASYNQAATAAAQGGLQDFLAAVRTRCAPPNASVDLCTTMPTQSGTTATTIPISGAATGYTATYRWTAVRVATASPAYFRVTSTGTAGVGGTNAKRVLVADVAGAQSQDVLDYGVVTGFEAQSASGVLAQWPARTIGLTCAGLAAADVPISGDQCASNANSIDSVSWSGAATGAGPGRVGVCNATFDASGGRSSTHPAGAPTPYVDWSETTTDGNAYTNYEPCQTSIGSFTRLLAPASTTNGAGGYYSGDALLLSNSYPGGSGPTLNQPTSSLWYYTAADAGVCGTAAGQNYRSLSLTCAGYPTDIGGAPASTSTFPTVQTVPTGPVIPTAAPTVPSGACVYAGPTRVRLTGTSAVITSPQTTAAWVSANASARPAQCYSGAGAGGMVERTISLTTPVTVSVIRAANTGTVPTATPTSGAYGSSGFPVTGQKATDTPSAANSVFFLTNGTASTTTASAYTVAAAPATYVPAVNDNPSTKSDGAWVPQWTSFTSGTTCPTTTVLTDLKFFNCYYNGNNNASSTYQPNAYGALKTALASAIAGNPAAYTSDPALATNLQTLVQNLVKAGNSTDAAASTPTNGTNASHRWVAGTAASGAAAGCTPSSGVAGTATTTPITAPSSDAFFTNTNGTTVATPSTDTSCYTVPVTAQSGNCTLFNFLVCVGQLSWGDGTGLLGGGKSVAQFTVTFTIRKTTTTTTVTAATSAFPNAGDITQYQVGANATSGPGDLYVEGTATNTTALVAADDVVITGSLQPANSATAALEVIGQNDVRVYHPVTCKITNATAVARTTAGFCPDDITGLYTNQPVSGQTPYDQYVNLRGDLAGLTVQAAVFALGNADAHLTCPQPSTAGGGVCGGDLTTDNYNRGASLGRLTLIGTFAMAHHSPVGQEWEITDTSGQTTRPWSGYQLTQQFLSAKALIAANSDVSAVLQTRSVTLAQWHVVSTSIGRA